jgi:hypothetical protein
MTTSIRAERLFEPNAFWQATVATALVAASIVLGSRRLADFDSALIGYSFACLFAVFGVVYRYSVWLSKPPTRRLWERGLQVFFSPRRWPRMNRPTLLARALWEKFVAQDFILHRTFGRWVTHMLIAWGCVLAAAVTFPLVFGWLHFEAAGTAASPHYRVVFFGLALTTVPLHGLVSWLTFHALVVSAFMVTPGVMMAIYRRMQDRGARAVQRFGRDMLPLVMLFAVSVTGLLLWVSYEWMQGYFYSVLAQIHALTVIFTLISLPFGKLFHIFQRPATIGISFYRAAGAATEQALCPVTREPFASRLQTADLGEVLPQVGFRYAPSDATKRVAWNEVSPRGRRMLIARAQSAAKHDRFA